MRFEGYVHRRRRDKLRPGYFLARLENIIIKRRYLSLNFIFKHAIVLKNVLNIFGKFMVHVIKFRTFIRATK